MARDDDDKEKDGDMLEAPIEEVLDETEDDEANPLIAPDEEEKAWE